MTAREGGEGAFVKERALRRHGLVAGALAATALALVACATGGAGSRGTDASGEGATAGATGDAAAAASDSTTGAASDSTTGAGSPVAAYLADAQAMGRAHQLFRAVCTGYCHSTQATADRVAPNLFDCEWDRGGTDEAIFESIAAGIPDTQMQGFGERLPHDDLWKLVAYLRQRTTCK